MTSVMIDRIDHPEHGFRWRGDRMEWAFARALHECLPLGSVTTGAKPAPEVHPPGAADPDTDDRADVDVITRTGQRFVFDVRTVNVQCASAARSTADAQCAAIEAGKRKHDNKYDRSIAPFVITFSGAVSQASAEALMRVLKAVARGRMKRNVFRRAGWKTSCTA